MRKHFSDYKELIPSDVLRDARSFRISYIGKYTSDNLSFYYRLFEFLPCGETGALIAEPIRFVATGESERQLCAELKNDGHVVHVDFIGTCRGCRLLYRDIKDMPHYY